MKSNKITIYVCSILALLSGTGIFFIERFIPTNTAVLQGISSGVFTGFIVSVVMAIIGYFHEREVLLNKAYYNLKTLYINMWVLSQTMGNVSSQIHTVTKLDELHFGTISELSKYNLELYGKMEIELFEPFFKKGTLKRIYLQLDHLQDNAYNIRNISQCLEKQVLEYSIDTLKSSQGQPSSADYIRLDNEKNAINLRAAHFHEYISSNTLELEKNIREFYRCRHKEKLWDELKPKLELQANACYRDVM